MKIACLGWGSLVWDPRELPVQGKWFEDGPFLPIEFARQSDDGRLTLVIVPEYKTRVRSLWTLFTVETIAEAQEALRKREGVRKDNIKDHIAIWPDETKKELNSPEITKWAQNLGNEAAIWTALPPKFGDENGRVPNAIEAIDYLRHQLSHEQRRNAERYIRMTPRQIDTSYRRLFEAEFGWTPLSEI